MVLQNSMEWPEEFSAIATAGFYVALRIGFAFPVDEKNEFPTDWVEYYTRNGLMLRDPVVHWAYANAGWIRWRDLESSDSDGILGKASDFGLKYGTVISCSTGGDDAQRSYGTFARADRDLSDEEISSLGHHLENLHDAALPPSNLTLAELEALKLVKEGLRLKEIAYQLGVSEGAIKQRLSGAKRKLGAKTNTHAASLAVMYRMI